MAAPPVVAGQPQVGENLATEIATDRAIDQYTASCERARRLLAVDRPAEALHACARAAALVAEGWEVHLLMGAANAASGAVEEARAEFELVLHLEPGCAPAAQGVADAVADLEDSEAAGPYRQRAADLLEYWGPHDSPTNGAAAPPRRQLSRAGLAHRFLRVGLWEHAVQEARACLEREPGRSDLVIALIRALWRSHQLAEARVALAALLNRQPLALPANLLAALDAQINGGDSRRPLARARRVDPLLRGAFRVLDAGELALLAPDLKMIDPSTSTPPKEPAHSPPDTPPAVAVTPPPPAREPAPDEPVVVVAPAAEAQRDVAAAADDLPPSDRESTVAATAAPPADSDDGALPTADAPRTTEEWRTIGNERRRQGDYAGAIAAYANALALLHPD